MSKLKNILFISPFSAPNIGGVETHIDLLRDYLAHKGYHSTLLTYQPLTSGKNAPSFQKNHFLTTYRFGWFGKDLFSRLQRYPLIFNFLYLTPYLLLRSFIYMLFNAKNVDVIHVFGLNGAIIGRLLKFFFHKPVVLTTKGVYGFFGYTTLGRITNKILSGLDGILVGSLDAKDDMLNLGLPNDKLEQFNYWIDHRVFKPNEKSKTSLRNNLGMKDMFTVIYAGRLIPEKGINAILDLACKLPDVQFIITGEGILEELIRIEAKKLKNVLFLGRVTTKNLSSYIYASDVFLFPVTYREDISLVILESLACRTPIISSFRGSGMYRLSDGISLICQSSTSEIYDAIVCCKSNPQKLYKMSKNSIEFADKFKEESAEIIIDYYKTILNK